MQIDVATTPVVDVYHTLVGVVTPRPIAWVTSVDTAGSMPSLAMASSAVTRVAARWRLR